MDWIAAKKPWMPSLLDFQVIDMRHVELERDHVRQGVCPAAIIGGTKQIVERLMDVTLGNNTITQTAALEGALR